MERLKERNKMAQFPISYSEQTPSGRGPNVPLNVNVNSGGEAIARGLANLGSSFEKMAQAKETMDYSTYRRQFHEVTYKALNAHRESNDPANMKEIEKNWSEYADSFGNDNKEFSMYKNNILPNLGQAFANQTVAFSGKMLDDEFNLNYEKLIEQNDYKGVEILVANAHKNGVKSVGNPALAEEHLRNAKQLIDSQMVYQHALTLSEDDGIKYIYGSDISDSDRRKLANYLEDYWAQLKHTNRVNAYNKAVKFYDQAIPDLSQGNINAEVIAQSDLLGKDDKEKWLGYVQGSYKEIKPTNEGYNNTINAVIQFSQGQLSKQQAYDEILGARYGKLNKAKRVVNAGAIDDDQFGWAINKINSPYSKDEATTISSALSNNRKQIAGYWESGKDLKKTQEVNTEILNWIDRQDKFPADEQIYRRSAELILGKRISEPPKIAKKKELSQLSDEELLKRIMGK